MNKERAIDILISHAVCSCSNLFCDEHCPNFDEAKRDFTGSCCKDDIGETLIVEAVKFMLENR